jgi:spermidine/putrescine transport system substrate-binding protein
MNTNPVPARRLSLSRRRFIHTSVAAFSGLALTRCGWRQVGVQREATPASPTDKLYVYTWSQYTDDELIKNFTSQFKAQVVADIYESNEAMLAKLQAGGGGNYSVIYPSDYMVRRMVEMGMLHDLDRSRLQGLDRLAPPFQNPTYDPENRHSIPMSWGTTGFVYNTQKLKEPPKDWEYLWKNRQQLSGRMTLIDDVREVMGATLRMLGYSYNSKDESQVKQAYEKLRELKPSIAAFDTDAWRSQILAGDLLLAMAYSTDGIKISQENPNLQYIIPASGTSLWTDTIAIPKTAPNLDAAYAWLNYNLEPTVAAEICQRQTVAIPNQVAIEQLPTQLRQNTNLFPPESILNKCERIAPLGDFDPVYDRYWTQLTSG